MLNNCTIKNLSNFWRTLEMSLINCEIDFILIWSANCVISSATGTKKFAITDTKLCVPVVTLLSKDNLKLWQQLKSGFKRTSNWKKISIKSNNISTKPRFKLLN